jgi:hypothetical protein
VIDDLADAVRQLNDGAEELYSKESILILFHLINASPKPLNSLRLAVTETAQQARNMDLSSLQRKINPIIISLNKLLPVFGCNIEIVIFDGKNR